MRGVSGRCQQRMPQPRGVRRRPDRPDSRGARASSAVDSNPWPRSTTTGVNRPTSPPSTTGCSTRPSRPAARPGLHLAPDHLAAQTRARPTSDPSWSTRGSATSASTSPTASRAANCPTTGPKSSRLPASSATDTRGLQPIPALLIQTARDDPAPDRMGRRRQGNRDPSWFIGMFLFVAARVPGSARLT
jgi:hypothetical protein